MGRYYSAHEYECLADYYEAGRLGSRSPASIARQRAEESRERREQERKTYEDMVRHHDKYGD